MKKIDVSLVKELRKITSAGVMACKKALIEVGGDIEKAVDYLRKKGIAKAEKRLERSAGEGVIHAYIHPGSRLGVLIDLRCETDFTARTEEFNKLAKDLAMQVAATNPKWIKKEDVPQEEIEHELEIYRAEAKEKGKPEKVIENIAKGRLEKYFQEVCLLEQNFIKDSSMKVEDLIKSYVSKLGEAVKVNRFVRFEIKKE
jgi:elongation factor Ts